MIDLLLIETGAGGDITISNKGLVTVNSIENMPYLCLFGGNVGQQTKQVLPGEFREYWWGNDIDPSEGYRFDSYTEAVLRDTPLTSIGRLTIENAIKRDLERMSSLLKSITVNVVIVSDDHIRITLQLVMIDGLQAIKVYEYQRNDSGDYLLEDYDENDYFTTNY